MIYKEVFGLTKMEASAVYKSNNRILETTWCRKGKVQEKGANAEILVSNLLKLCEGIEILEAIRNSELDEILKVDLVVSVLDDPKDVFAFQIKSSLTGAKIHYEKYSPAIKYQNMYFRTPWCLIVDGSLTNRQLLTLLMNELILECSLDFDFLDKIEKLILKDNNKALSVKKIRKLNRKELRALRLLYNISKGPQTFFLNT